MSKRLPSGCFQRPLRPFVRRFYYLYVVFTPISANASVRRWETAFNWVQARIFYPGQTPSGSMAPHLLLHL